MVLIGQGNITGDRSSDDKNWTVKCAIISWQNFSYIQLKVFNYSKKRIYPNACAIFEIKIIKYCYLFFCFSITINYNNISWVFIISLFYLQVRHKSWILYR